MFKDRGLRKNVHLCFLQSVFNRISVVSSLGHVHLVLNENLWVQFYDLSYYEATTGIL
jgi:hypothetical protein